MLSIHERIKERLELMLCSRSNFSSQYSAKKREFQILHAAIENLVKVYTAEVVLQ